MKNRDTVVLYTCRKHQNRISKKISNQQANHLRKSAEFL